MAEPLRVSLLRPSPSRPFHFHLRCWQVTVAVCGLLLLLAYMATVTPPPNTSSESSTDRSAASLHPILSSSASHIHFRVQSGLRVVTQAELDALHVRQRQECDDSYGVMSDDEIRQQREQWERWRKCTERNESQWTCSACTYPLLDYHESWGRGLQNSSARIADQQFVSHFTGAVPLHGFVHAVHESYRRHLPLTIAVEDVWILIIQGLSQHINHGHNAERLRHHFVSHQGQEVMEVAGCSWQQIIEQFAEEISVRTVPGRVSLFAQPFSATSAVQSLVMQAAVMEAMQSYYEYRAMLICGIPSVTLLGTADDWLDLQRRLDDLRLSELDASLALWDARLKGIVGAMVASRQGRVNERFWQSLYRVRADPSSMFQGCSGPPDSLDGYVTSFFPYITASLWQHKYTDVEPNPALFRSTAYTLHEGVQSEVLHQLSLSQLPTGISRVPIKWMNSPSGVKSIRLYAGFDDASVTYDDGMEGGGEVRATYGWALTE